jgi:hypothetical protein
MESTRKYITEDMARSIAFERNIDELPSLNHTVSTCLSIKEQRETGVATMNLGQDNKGYFLSENSCCTGSLIAEIYKEEAKNHHTMIRLYQVLLRLDGPILVSDSKVMKIIKRKILKPIGYYFRKKNFNAKISCR